MVYSSTLSLTVYERCASADTLPLTGYGINNYNTSSVIDVVALFTKDLQMIIPPLIEPEDSNLVCEENFILYKRGDWNATSDVPTEVKDYKYYSGSQILEFTAPN